MHDIDRTQLEGGGTGGYGPQPPGRFGFDGQGEPAGSGEAGSGGYGEVGESGGYGEGAEFGSGFGEIGEAAGYGEYEGPLGESEEIELASELLEVSNEQELEQFLGNVFNAVQGAAGRFVRSDTGQALGGILKDTLKDAARQALPVVGRAIGQWVSPERGGEPGARIASAAGTLLGLELEGLSGEDREFEVARQLVRFVSAAVNRAALAPRTAPAPVVARAAVRQAARVYAPGLVPRLQGRSTRLWPRGGRWIRRGRTIVLFGG
jgi:hypothetical protein